MSSSSCQWYSWQKQKVSQTNRRSVSIMTVRGWHQWEGKPVSIKAGSFLALSLSVCRESRKETLERWIPVSTWTLLCLLIKWSRRAPHTTFSSGARLIITSVDQGRTTCRRSTPSDIYKNEKRQVQIHMSVITAALRALSQPPLLIYYLDRKREKKVEIVWLTFDVVVDCFLLPSLWQSSC